MHARAVPVQVLAQWFGIVIDSQAIALGSTLQQVARHPGLIPGALGALAKYLKLPLTGRDLGRPEHFRLVLSGSRCVLLHQETEARLQLTETSCVAE